MFFPFGKRARRQRLAKRFPPSWLSLLHDNVLFYRALPQAEQARLRGATAILVAEKNWEGCAGQVITDEVKVTIAGQAGVLLLGLEDYYFDELDTILVYPGGFLSVWEDELGGEDETQMVLGQAFRKGPVLLSWWHARWGGGRLGPVNVVLHEFAHKLAELGDAEAGRPPLVERSLEERWDRVMESARMQLEKDDERGRDTLLDPYGAESPAEFFAVATETFFLEPAALKRRHRDVYELLAACYHQDPAKWVIPADVAQTAGIADEEYSRQAIAECTAALKLRPDYLEAYRERATYRLDLGDVDGARADLDHAAKLDPQDPAIRRLREEVIAARRESGA